MLGDERRARTSTQLYQQPLSAFTAARNALAKTLSGAEAHRIKRLAKPTVVPWTINQLYWRARDDLRPRHPRRDGRCGTRKLPR